MTTNVLDITQAIVATDSRWSIPLPFGLFYVDDTGFDKIELNSGHAFMFAGNGLAIQRWKEWIRMASRTPRAPAVEGIALCVVNVSTVEVLFEKGQDIVLADARFAGTGSYHAHLCWTANRCARQAVESAKLEDKMTGGSVTFVELRTGVNNLTNVGTISSVAQDLANRGWVMYSNARTSVPVSDAVANDPRMAQIVKDVATGAVVATAPCDSMYNQWTDSDKEKLRNALSKVFGHKVE